MDLAVKIIYKGLEMGKVDLLTATKNKAFCLGFFSECEKICRKLCSSRSFKLAVTIFTL